MMSWGPQCSGSKSLKEETQLAPHSHTTLSGVKGSHLAGLATGLASWPRETGTCPGSHTMVRGTHCYSQPDPAKKSPAYKASSFSQGSQTVSSNLALHTAHHRVGSNWSKLLFPTSPRVFHSQGHGQNPELSTSLPLL